MRTTVTFEAPGVEPKVFDGGTAAPELQAVLVDGLRAQGVTAAPAGNAILARDNGNTIDVFVAYRGADFLVGVSKHGDDALANRVRAALDAAIRAIPDVRAVVWHEENP